MKQVSTYLLLVLLLGATSSVWGQISPGPLSQAHAELEGIRNCTLCHDLGDKVSDQKCLECHKEIQSLVTDKRGYHSDRSVSNKDCFECHSEHHGRKFDMMRFDEDDFNHNLTGYKLEGQHDVIDCRKCHAPENIADADLRKRDNTFLGLDQQCLSCHDDYHQKSLSNDCASCHNIESFRPAPNFDHDETDYPLKGKHAEVECIECHAVTTRNGEEFQQFSDIAFSACTDCHDDVHNNQIAGACTQCHNENSFSNFLGQRGFNHSQTDFTLKGKHNTTNCFECHARTSNPLRVFQDQENIDENNCVACHDDFHEGKYGNECAKCHNEKSFLSLNDMSFFDHTVTDYPLEGKHQEVDCKQCHIERFSTPIDFSACNHCHEDYHDGEFAQGGTSPDCIECHSLNEGFDYSLYTLEQHQTTSFPLEGAHIATPCFACHISEKDERWTFRNIGAECIDCHQDIHEGEISESFYPDNECEVCHINDAWASVTFNHNLTEWPLDGKHLEVDCRDCHFEMAENDTDFTQSFNTLANECVSCHDNVHGDEFAISGVTDCVRCHVTESWFPDKFDHSLTQFPLEGRHAEIDCRACHEVPVGNGSTEVVYKIEKFECIDCHQ